jgi:hypothetical protein
MISITMINDAWVSAMQKQTDARVVLRDARLRAWILGTTTVSVMPSGTSARSGRLRAGAAGARLVHT